MPTIDEFSCSYFDCEETSLDAILHAAETLPLGYEKKVVVAKNAYFFSDTFPKRDSNDDEDYKRLNSFIQQNDSQIILIFCLNSTKISDKKDLMKNMKKFGKIISITELKENERVPAIKKLVDIKKIQFSNNRAFEEFAARVGSDWESIANEVQKLALYGEVITLEVVQTLISRPLEDNIFGIIDALLEHDIEKALNIFYDLRVQNEDPVSLLPRMASQLRHMYQVLYLKRKGYNEGSITNELNVHPYRVTLALRKRGTTNEKKLLKMINDLAVLDLEIKSGFADKYQAFEMFLVKHA